MEVVVNVEKVEGVSKKTGNPYTRYDITFETGYVVNVFPRSNGDRLCLDQIINNAGSYYKADNK